jgi:phage baseplate assembly protein W
LALPRSATGRVGFHLTEIDDIFQCIAVILTTPPGTLPRNPGFGCRLRELLYRPMDAGVKEAAEFFVKESIGRWERRVEVVDVTVAETSPAQPGQLAVTIEVLWGMQPLRYEHVVGQAERSTA